MDRPARRRSAVHVTRAHLELNAQRTFVPLNAMCSRKWAVPFVFAVS